MSESTEPTDFDSPRPAGPVNASALIVNSAGEYLLHLRDHIPGVWEPGAWALLGGGREPGDASLEDTVRRELHEEAGLDLPDLTSFAVDTVPGTDGSPVPIQVFTGQWNGNPDALPLAEGVMLRWFRPETMPRLRLARSTLELIRRHARLSGPRDHDRLSRPLSKQRGVPGAGASGRSVFTVIGVHLYLENPDGLVLLGLRHSDSAFAGESWHFLAGHCEWGESMLACLVREAEEEAGLIIQPEDAELVHVVHLVDEPGGQPRMGLVFRVRRWQGQPELREPDKCLAWRWWDPDELPTPIVPYTQAAIQGIRNGRPHTELGWRTGLPSGSGADAPALPRAQHNATPADLPGPDMSDTAYMRSRHAVWMSAAAIFTDALQRVLLVKPTYRRQWLLPGGAAEPHESPRQACRREITEEIGLERVPGRLLAVHWLPPNHPDIDAGIQLPGEIRYLFDGGTLADDEITDLRMPQNELTGFEFVDSTQLDQHMIPLDARIALAALRARLSGTTAHLEGGQHVDEVPPLDRHDVRLRFRAGLRFPLLTEPLPADLAVRQSWGWLFVPDGRVVLVVDPGNRLPALPGGTVETTDASPEETLRREAVEEAQITIGEPVRLGWVHDTTGGVDGGPGSCARLRLAAPVTEIGAVATDPATGRTFARLLATPEQAAALLGWDEQVLQQAELAARVAHTRWGIPRATPSAITELPKEGFGM
ncbi:NUDIX hydrolase [Streptomyces lunalinharesii]|uniref:Nudix hydrolase domain-containing protein n=1 Tax=Streptomyces lunalinharesii TaxID=333384 RepID=A0ABN3RYP1_9ACTN